jgi:hypothetical protein
MAKLWSTQQSCLDFANNYFFLRVSANSLSKLNLEDRIFSVVRDCSFNWETDSVIGVTEFMEYKLLL